MKTPFWLIRTFSRLVPRRFRSDWQQEWEAELRHRQSLGRSELIRRSLGSFWDALALQPRRLEEEIFQDLRYGARMLLKNRGIAAMAILSLALGIGANSALFSLVDRVYLQTLHVRNPSELVQFSWSSGPNAPFLSYDGNSRRTDQTGASTGTSFSYPIFQELRAQNQALTDLFAFNGTLAFNVVADGQAGVVTGQFVSGNYYTVLGVQAERGRMISEEDDRAGADAVVVISHRLWERRFQLDPTVVGKNVTVNGIAFTVAGIAPPEFSGTLQINESPDISIPIHSDTSLGFDHLKRKAAWWLQIMGRLKPGFTFDQVRGNLEGAFQASALEGWRADAAAIPPGADRFLVQRAQVVPAVPRLQVRSGSQGPQEQRDAYRQPTRILLLIVAAVLLIACINIANLMLARATSRQKEIAVRLAMGARRFRLIRQLLTESILLALCGGALGALLAYGGQRLLITWGPWTTPTDSVELALDMRVFGFTLILSLFSAVLFGLLPAFRATRMDLNPAIKEQSRSVAAGRSYLSKALLTAQVAMSVMLLIGAGLFVRTLQNLYHFDAGFNSANLLLFNLDPSLNKYTPAQMYERFERTAELIKAMPGVRAVSLSQRPLASVGSTADRFVTPNGVTFSARILYIRSNFFDTMGMRLLSGRSISPDDRRETPKVIIINETLARTYLANNNPIGARLGEQEIVGIVSDAKYTSFRQDTPPTIYIPYTQGPVRQMTFEVRSTATDPLSLLPQIREAVRQVDKNLPVTDVRTQTEQIGRTMASERLFAVMSSLFGGLALLLACVGLYGLMSYSVARRTNEIGLRMALGAAQRDVLRSMMRESLMPVFAGVILGVGGALPLTRTIKATLFGLTPYDPATVTIAILVMIAVAAFAGYLPARKASKVDPLIALRYE